MIAKAPTTEIHVFMNDILVSKLLLVWTVVEDPNNTLCLNFIDPNEGRVWICPSTLNMN